ncbi:hypothetical protein LTR49_011719 [Elasticomyces elasticus]|nr:hypothetical protein LTR49_011719 [Elasticomyces elasticus]
MDDEERSISVCKTSVDRIYSMLRTSPQEYQDFLPLARSVISHIDGTSFMQQTRRTAEQSWLIGGLQRLALIDNGNCEALDICTWCTRQWMTVTAREPQNVEALRGLGKAWLGRAQPSLTRIHRTDGCSSSSRGSSQSCTRTSNESERRSAAAVAEAERRVGTADYVEARGFLQPAIEYLGRAVAAATTQRALSGDLLATTAEAYMSLGNASSPRTNEQYFRRALQLLRAATTIQGYTLNSGPSDFARYSITLDPTAILRIFPSASATVPDGLSDMIDERELIRQPIVQESVQHNARTVSNIRALTASLFGVAAGTLGLESFPGFIFYFLGTAVVSLLIYALKAESKPEAYFYNPLGDLWAGDMFGGLMSFVLTWTLFYGLCKA